MRICFSILAHEAPDVLTGQIRNFALYNPGCVIALHLNPSIGEYVPPDDVMAEIIVNPTRYSLYWCGSLVHAINANFKAAIHATTFDRFEIHASNDLFIKHGRSSYNDGSDASMDSILQSVSSGWAPISRTQRTVEWAALDAFVPGDVWGCYLEGTSYSTALFTEIVQIYDRVMPGFTPDCAFEEVFYSTLSHRLTTSIGANTQYECKIHNNPTTDTIDLIMSDVIYYNAAYGLPTYPFDMRYRYSLRRIMRKVDDPVRQYIMSGAHHRTISKESHDAK